LDARNIYENKRTCKEGLYILRHYNQLIREIAETFKEDKDEGNAEEMDDNTEITTISVSSALESLENVAYFFYSKKTQMNR